MYAVSSRASAGSNSSRKRDQQRRDAAKAQLAVDALGELLDRPQARLAPRLGERLGEHDPTLRAQPTAEAIDELARVEALVPDVEVALAREAAHRLAVLAHAGRHDPPPAICREPDVAAGDLGAGRHPLDVPLPRAGQRLVEVVRAEHEPAVRSCESAEVRDVGVAAGLHDDARIRRRREVGRHDGSRAAVERERRDEHPPVADRDELLHARGRLGREHRDGIGPVRRRRPVAVSRPGRTPARRSATLCGLPGLQPCLSRGSHALLLEAHLGSGPLTESIERHVGHSKEVRDEERRFSGHGC